MATFAAGAAGGPRFLRGWPGPARCASEARCSWGLRKRERGPSRTRGRGGTCSTSAGASLFLLLRPLCALWPSFGTPSPTGSQASAAARGRPRLVGGGGPLGQCAARARAPFSRSLCPRTEPGRAVPALVACANVPDITMGRGMTAARNRLALRHRLQHVWRRV